MSVQTRLEPGRTQTITPDTLAQGIEALAMQLARKAGSGVDQVEDKQVSITNFDPVSLRVEARLYVAGLGMRKIEVIQRDETSLVVYTPSLVPSKNGGSTVFRFNVGGESFRQEFGLERRREGPTKIANLYDTDTNAQALRRVARALRSPVANAVMAQEISGRMS